MSIKKSWCRDRGPIVIKEGKIIPDGLDDCFLKKEILLKEFKNIAKLNRAIGESYRGDVEYKEFCDSTMDIIVDKSLETLLVKHGKPRKYKAVESTGINPVRLIPQIEKETNEIDLTDEINRGDRMTDEEKQRGLFNWETLLKNVKKKNGRKK